MKFVDFDPPFSAGASYPEAFNHGSVHALINKHASGQKRVSGNLGKLMLSPNYGPRLVPHYTTGNLEKDVALLTGKLEDGDILLAIGGEYTARVCVNALISDDLYQKAIALMLNECGDGSDGARMTINRNLKDNPGRALDIGHLEKVTPFKIIFNNDPSTEVNPLLYFGLGNVARMVGIYTTEEFRSSPLYKYRSTRFVQQAISAVVNFPKREPFTISDDNGQRELYEYFVANGSRIAKVGSLPINLDEERYWLTECAKLDELDNLATIIWLGTMVSGTPLGRPIPYDGPNNAPNVTSLVVETDTDMHIDGDKERISANTRIDISRADRSLYLIAA